MASRHNKKSGSKLVGGFLLVALLAGAGYIYTAPEFEREAPTVQSSDNIYWNRTDPLRLQLSDNVGLNHFELILSDGVKSLIVGQGDLEKDTKEQTLLVKYPKSKILRSKSNKSTLTSISE